MKSMGSLLKYAAFVCSFVIGACASGMDDGDDNPGDDDQSDDTQAVCGDGACDGTENSDSCPADCGGGGGPVCGDGTCNGNETINTCAQDCGGTTAQCGDGNCNGGETATSCPADCTGGGGTCNNDFVCDAGENSTSCPGDCPAAAGCGDAVCDVAGGECESADFNCLLDCIFEPTCGGGGGGGTPSCDHDVCTEGGPLMTSCDACSAAVCAEDPYCCDTEWDVTCTGEVTDFCDPGTCP